MCKENLFIIFFYYIWSIINCFFPHIVTLTKGQRPKRILNGTMRDTPWCKSSRRFRLFRCLSEYLQHFFIYSKECTSCVENLTLQKTLTKNVRIFLVLFEKKRVINKIKTTCKRSYIHSKLVINAQFIANINIYIFFHSIFVYCITQYRYH